MKTPITYYGGKQRLVSTILPLIPTHRIYCEPFVGGGALFFAKPPSEVEVVNDINSELINFYEVLQRDYTSLEKEIQISLHSRDLHRKAKVIYQNPDMFSKIQRAWAVWMVSAQGFGGKLDSSFGYDRTGTTSKKIMHKREGFTWEYGARLQNVQIECTDALRIIRSRDTEETFFYCDPPYVNSDCGHYDGYTIEDFTMLLHELCSIKGRFLLSSYPLPVVDEYAKEYGWQQKRIDMPMSVNAKAKKRKLRKTEVLTANYALKSGEFEFLGGEIA